MRVLSSRRLRGFRGYTPGQSLTYFNEVADAENVTVRPSTAVAGLGLFILGGVLTHIAVRIVDRWFFR